MDTAFTRSKKDTKPKDKLNYSDPEKKYLGFLIRRLEQARDQREQKHTELDDKNFTKWHEDNARSANSYNPPKVNPEDSRINTGIVRERVGTLLSATLNYNFEAAISASQKNNAKVYGLGETMEDTVKKSRDLEHYEDKRRLIYKEIFDQGTAYAMEIKKEHVIVEKKLKQTDISTIPIDEIEWEKNLKTALPTLEVELLSSLGVYLGNFKEFFIQEQPYVFTREVVPYDIAASLYRNFPRWKYVPNKMSELKAESSTDYENWRLLAVENDFVEIIKYFDRPNNEFMVQLNGIMMLPIEFPMTVVSPSGLYPIAKGDAEPISKFFSLSRSIPSKTEVDQKLLDETIRMLLLKTQRSLTPPMVNNTNKILSRKIMLPGNITKGVNPEHLQPIGPTDGPSLAEFNMFNLMREINNGKSIDPVFAGEDGGREKTATEVIQRKQQQMMKLGQGLIGIIEFERQLVLLRIYNILSNWTLPISQRVDAVRNEIVSVYQTFEVDTTFKDSGKRGSRIVSFNPEDKKKMGEDKIASLEQSIKDKTGKEVRFSFLDADLLRTVEFIWDISITPTEKNSSELDRVLFMQNITQAIQIFGPQSLNMNYVKERFAVLAKEDPAKLFTQAEATPMQEGEGQEGNMGAQMLRGVQGATQQPSLNSLVQA